MGTAASTEETSSGAIHSSSGVGNTSCSSAPLSPLSPVSSSFASPSPSAAESPNLFSSADGYKWRKYGQKKVKGKEYPKHYFKCTFPGCSVKKYVEKLEEDGKLLERVTYRGGEHTHDPARITRLSAADQLSFKKSVISENFSQHPELLMKSTEGMDLPESSGTESVSPFPASPRLVVETSAEVDHLDDGYGWRKYGQKKLPPDSMRSYYRCSEEDCPVKKQVEQRGGQVFNIYEGTHNHPAPGLEEGIKKRRKLLQSSFESPQALLQGLRSEAAEEIDIVLPNSGEEHLPLQALRGEHEGSSSQQSNTSTTATSSNSQ